MSQDEFAGDKTQPSEEIIAALNSPVKTEPSSQSLPPLSEFDSLRAQLTEKPHSPALWKRLVEIAEQSGETEKIKVAFDSLLKQYPNTSAAQISYISHYLDNPKTFGEAEALFTTFLKHSPSVDLFRFYLTYVRRVHSDPTKRDPAKREVVRKAYEFALNPPHGVGQDKDAGDIWHDYIQFLSESEATATTTWDQQQNMDALRKVYHRAVQIPLDNVEKLWQDLEAFEMKLNKITAKKFMADLSPAHMQARTVYRQLNNYVSTLYPPSTGRPELFLPSLPSFDPAERSTVGKWKGYLKWEESNPLEIEDKDKPLLILRVQTVYRKAVIRMRYFPEIWYMAYTWTKSIGKNEEAMSILKNGREANPLSFLLTFAYAEALEANKKYDEVKTTFDTFLANLRVDLEAVEQKVKSANSSFSSANGDIPGVQPPANETSSQSNNYSFNSQSSDETPPKSSELAEKRAEYGLVYICYMRFMRRTEGVMKSRLVFSTARKDRWCPWEVYEAAALMEFHCTNDKNIASRIFEKGLNTFATEIEFVIRYLAFLISINDENNARALFERVINTFPPEKARPLWERWARYEYQYADLEAALKLEKRMADVYPNDPPLKRFAQRHVYLGVDAIAARDLGVAIAKKSTSALGRSDTIQSLLATPPTPVTGGTKRPPSPEHRKPRDDRSGDYGPSHKRARPNSPPLRSSDRDRWESSRDGPSSSRGRRYSPPPPSSKDRERPPLPPPRRQEKEKDKEEEKPVTLPPVISYFLGSLPSASEFDGPVFRTEDLMNLFRNAVIPSSSSSRARSPPPPPPVPPRGGGRPPPDYSPYQGPGGGSRGGRRY
ncbi:Suf-domain-containing protein [Armillaria solidipes]|uniref:mRNA 3'-end-processing protein RNA14 n=1 Tax=Armillaria solidipes TaxID=1076256 RepID=A0A2H3BYW6_9AGAR|nr:Suf-domain-containing protein [Armillaria solidipes]